MLTNSPPNIDHLYPGLGLLISECHVIPCKVLEQACALALMCVTYIGYSIAAGGISGARIYSTTTRPPVISPPQAC